MSASQTYRQIQADSILDPRSVAELYAYFKKQAPTRSGTSEQRTPDPRDPRTRTTYEVAAYYPNATHICTTTDQYQARELARCATTDAIYVLHTTHTARKTWRGLETNDITYRWQAGAPHWQKITP